MWVFTKYGFFSAGCARQGDGSHGQPVDPNHLMIRGRLRSHLEALKQRFSDLLAECEIREFPETDYAFRLFVPKIAWEQILAELAAEIDYENFKSEVAQFQGRAGAAYERPLDDVWSVMHRLQNKAVQLQLNALPIGKPR